MKKWLALVLIIIGIFLLWQTSRDYPSQLEEMKATSQVSFQAIFIEDSFCLACPDGDVAFEVAAIEHNVVFVDAGWSTQDIDNLIRALQPECGIVISTDELKDFFLKRGEKIGHIYSILVSN